MCKVSELQHVNNENTSIERSSSVQSEQQLQDSIFDMHIKRGQQKAIKSGFLATGLSVLDKVLQTASFNTTSRALGGFFGIGAFAANIASFCFLIEFVINIINVFNTKKQKETNRKINERKRVEEEKVEQIRQENDSDYKAPEKKYSHLTVAIVDNFDKKSTGITGKPHGELVEKYIRETLPGVKILRYYQKHDKDMISPVENLLKDIEAGVKIDAVNLSFSIGSSAFCDAADSIAEMKRKFDRRPVTNIFENMILNNYRKTIEQITDRGVKVYQAHTNQFPSAVSFTDLYNFNSKYPNSNNPNLITVGAKERNIGFFTKNPMYFPFADARETSIFKTQVIGNGVDITGDGLVDYPKEDFAAKVVSGNSFATPLKLAKDLR